MATINKVAPRQQQQQSSAANQAQHYTRVIASPSNLESQSPAPAVPVSHHHQQAPHSRPTSQNRAILSPPAPATNGTNGSSANVVLKSPNPQRFSQKSTSPANNHTSVGTNGVSPRTPGGSRVAPGGTALLINGMAKAPPGQGASRVFRSSASIGDAHIKDLSSHVEKQPYRAPSPLTSNGGAKASFSSTSPSDRDAHYLDLKKGTYATPRQGSPVLPQDNTSPSRLQSASFRSKSPTACAHIGGKPVNASYQGHLNWNGAGAKSKDLNSPSYRSGSSIADAHIKAQPRFKESSSPMADISKGMAGGTSAFRSTTSNADAHIKALPKFADMCVAYAH